MRWDGGEQAAIYGLSEALLPPLRDALPYNSVDLLNGGQDKETIHLHPVSDGRQHLIWLTAAAQTATNQQGAAIDWLHTSLC